MTSITGGWHTFLELYKSYNGMFQDEADGIKRNFKKKTQSVFLRTVQGNKGCPSNASLVNGDLPEDLVGHG